MNSKNQDILISLDEETFERLFKKHFKGFCFFAQRYVKDLDIAKEIVQDAFINLWNNRKNIDLSKSVKSYISTSIYNRSLNYLRDQKKFNHEIFAFENLALSIEASQSYNIESRELENKIKDAINELPEKCREIFIMSRYENLKYTEIADKLQVSVKTVEAQISKALTHMRIRLVEYLTQLLIIFTISSFFEK